ncbi:MAG: hydantoinase/oxoprolinase family protein [Hyphomicrobiaceae bacterium]
MSLRVGVDIGGTFTDFFVFNDKNRSTQTLKVLSTPNMPGAEVMTGLQQLDKRFHISSTDIAYFTHGTTVGVNTVIQRRGATLALVTTAGFEDVLEVARLKMPDPYDLFSRRPAPLVARERVFGVTERILADGNVETPIDEKSVRRAIEDARACGAEAIVIALLHSYANAAHEQQVAGLARSIVPDMEIVLSSDVWPVIREYERTVTATVSGYVQRRIEGYLTSLQATLCEAGVAAEPMITKSNGGVMRAELGKSAPIQMLLSGTASGVIGASHVAALAGEENVLSYDVGGTSADVAVIQSGKPAYGTGELVGEFPIYTPTVAVTSIGAGGGSIAHVDNLDVLKVGPASAGSNPGPACYSRGGHQATITDAYAVCGWLGGGGLGYGSVQIDMAGAKRAVGDISNRLGRNLEQSAEAIINVSISGVFLEVSKLLSRRGADPRQFALLPFGGAGPMMACLLARDLGFRKIIVPPAPGVLAAFGGLIADVRNDFIQTAFVDLDETSAKPLNTLTETLRERALTWLRGAQEFRGEARLMFSGDMRYRGQSYEIEVPLDADWLDSGALGPIEAAFHREHERIYEYSDRNANIQLINLRLVVSGVADRPQFEVKKAQHRTAQATEITEVFYDGVWRKANVYLRKHLRPGETFSGPAIVRQDDCTTCLVEGFEAEIDGHGNIIISARG